jgi:predicted Zn finger-like uncharacterized protein
MLSTLTCPSCERPLRVPENLLGQLVKCPACEHTFTAPESEEAIPVAIPLRSRDRDDSRRRREDEEDLPRHRRYAEDEDDRRPARRGAERKPEKVQAISIMTLVGGILAVLISAGLMATCIGFVWPGTYYSLVLGILAIIKGAQLLSDKAYRESPPQATAIMQIINIINLDAINLALGIIVLVFLSDRDVKAYFRK